VLREQAGAGPEGIATALVDAAVAHAEGGVDDDLALLVLRVR
jgi:hypothetical protein